MSWDSWCTGLVDSAEGKIPNVALVGLDGSLWGSSENGGFSVTQADVDAIAGYFNGDAKAEEAKIFGSGVSISGTKYMATEVDLKNDSRPVIHAKKGANGVFLIKLASVVVVGLYSADARYARPKIEKLADKLAAKNY